MPQFEMDKTGAVVAPSAVSLAPGNVTLWKDLDAFTQGYIEAMFFTEEREHVDGGWVDGDQHGYTLRRKWLAGVSAQRGF